MTVRTGRPGPARPPTSFGRPPRSGAVPVVDPRERSPAGVDEALERFDRFSSALVRLEVFSLEEVRGSVAAFLTEVEVHLGGSPIPPVGSDRPPRAGPPEGDRLEGEHERFRTSVDELRSLLGVVEGDDHGGHRQALGQYGRIFAEALRLHRRDERAATAADGPGGARVPSA